MNEQAAKPGALTGRDVVILAGGLGTRIRATLGDTPKALALLAAGGGAAGGGGAGAGGAGAGGDGITMLGLLLDQLIAQGADRAVLALGHRAEAVVAWLAGAASSDRTYKGLTVTPVTEPEPLGTAGALRHVRPYLRPGPVVVMNGDTVVTVDFAALLARWAESKADIAIFCVHAADAGRYGRVTLTEDGWVAGFAEKEPNAGAGMINAGVYVFSDAGLNAVATSDAVSLERDVFQRAPAGAIAAFSDRAADGEAGFVDIGTPEGLARARAMLRADAGPP